MNYATLQPITSANAAEYARRATISRERNRRERNEQAARDKIPTAPDARKLRAGKQLDKLDDWIDKALEKGDEERFLKLNRARAELWRLIEPTAGTLKPRAVRQPATGAINLVALPLSPSPTIKVPQIESLSDPAGKPAAYV